MSQPTFNFNNCQVTIYTAERESTSDRRDTGIQHSGTGFTGATGLNGATGMTGPTGAVEYNNVTVKVNGQTGPTGVNDVKTSAVGNQIITKKQMMVSMIKALLDECDNTRGKAQKTGVAKCIFRIISDNEWFMKEHTKFGNVVKAKALEFLREEEAREFATKFLKRFFPEEVEVSEDSEDEVEKARNAPVKALEDLEEGDFVDALDTQNKWYQAKIQAIRTGCTPTYYVHYIGWADKWDAWIGLDKMAPKGTHTDRPYEAEVDLEAEVEVDSETEEASPKKQRKSPRRSTHEFQGTHTKFEADGTTTVTPSMKDRIAQLIKTVKEAQDVDRPVAVQNLFELLQANPKYLESHPALSKSVRNKCESFLDNEYDKYHEFVVPFVREFYPDDSTLKELCEPPNDGEISDSWEEW